MQKITQSYSSGNKFEIKGADFSEIITNKEKVSYERMKQKPAMQRVNFPDHTYLEN